MASGEIQISALPQATLPVSVNDLFHLKQGIVDKRCTLEQLLYPHASLRNNPHGVTNVQVGLGSVINALQLVASENLADIPNKALARENLGVLDTVSVEGLINNHTSNTNNPHKVTHVQVGLSNIQNWTYSHLYNEDANKYATAKAVNALYEALKAQYPVGSIHLTTNPANPATYLICGGVWELTSQDRALVGYKDNSRAVETAFGNKTATLSITNLPAHSHSVTLTGGTHSHSATTTVNSFDHGTKTASSFDHGTKNTSSFDHGNKITSNFDYGTKSTNISGEHTHNTTVPWGGYGIGDRYPYTCGERREIESSPAGNHSHTVTIGAHTHTVAIGAHTHSVNIGSHSHTVAIGAHTHTAQTTLSESSHTHTGNTDSVGGGTPFNIEQPSYVVYVWKRVA